MYMFVIAGYKVAVCQSYLEILKNVNTRLRDFVRFVLITTIVIHIATTLVIVLQCQPTQKSWKPWIAGSCLPNFETKRQSLQ